MFTPPRPDPLRIGGSTFETMLSQRPLVIGVAGKNGDSFLRVAQCCFENSARDSRLRVPSRGYWSLAADCDRLIPIADELCVLAGETQVGRHWCISWLHRSIPVRQLGRLRSQRIHRFFGL